ncbi:MAG: DUF3710 domain-containing protein [Candidatus Nanopelagicales bacterium]
MARFRRRSAPSEPAEPSTGAAGDSTAVDPASSAPTGGPPDEAAQPSGPFDESDAGSAESTPRVDLGGLRIPMLPGISVQVEADSHTQEVVAVTAVAGDAAVQLQAFAAPRSEGLWDEIRAEMLADIRSTAEATIAEEEGEFGTELRAVLPGRTPDGKQVKQAVRFVGVDGPRWFLRAVFLGRAALGPAPRDELVQLVRQTIVVRGSQAMAPRDPLPLKLPEQPQEGSDEEAAGDVEHAEDVAEVEDRFEGMDPFERGPEITEVR